MFLQHSMTNASFLAHLQAWRCLLFVSNQTIWDDSVMYSDSVILSLLLVDFEFIAITVYSSLTANAFYSNNTPQSDLHLQKLTESLYRSFEFLKIGHLLFFISYFTCKL